MLDVLFIALFQAATLAPTDPPAAGQGMAPAANGQPASDQTSAAPATRPSEAPDTHRAMRCHTMPTSESRLGRRVCVLRQQEETPQDGHDTVNHAQSQMPAQGN